MNLKQHPFWVVCGVVLLGLIAAWVLVVPTGEAREAKERLDVQRSNLDKLAQRAANGNPVNKQSPDGAWDAENQDDTARLSRDYLITAGWLAPLRTVKAQYDEQLVLIAGKPATETEPAVPGLLTSHGRNLFQPIPVTDKTDRYTWYTAYYAESDRLVQSLLQAGCLPPLPSADAAGKDSSKASTELALRSLRTAIGLFTKERDYPLVTDHAFLTVRLRTLQQLAGLLVASAVPVPANPLIGPTGRSDDRARTVPRLVSVTWNLGGTGRGTEIVSAPTDEIQIGDRKLIAEGIGMQLVCNGSAAALLDLLARLEQNPPGEQALTCVLGAKLVRNERFAENERLDAATERMQLTVELRFIAFQLMTADEAAAAGLKAKGESGQSPAGGGSGMGGFNPPPPAVTPPRRNGGGRAPGGEAEE